MAGKHVLRELSRADYITLLAVLVILNAFWLLVTSKTELAIALAFGSMFLDYLDGIIAQKNGSSNYGGTLDALYDVLGWVLFPALAINIQTGWAWWAVVVTNIFCLAAVVRLGRFAQKGYVVKNNKYYMGLPVLFSKYALLLCLLFDAKISVLILAIMAPLMVSSRLFKKPQPIWAWLELLYAAIFLLLYLRHA